MADSARARSLAQIADLADLDAGRRAQLEARDHRTRLHRHHFGLDAEIAQLQLHQARHGLQRLVRIGLLARPRLIEQRQRRQFARLRRIEQRHLALALDALALLRHAAPAPRCAAAAGWRLSSAPRAPLPGAPACAAGRRRARAAARCRVRAHSIALQHPGAELVHDLEPRDAEEQRHAGEPQARAAAASRRESSSPRARRCPTSSPSTPPALFGSADAVPMQRREAAAREQGQHEPGRAQQRVEARARVGQRLILVHQPAGVGQHERETGRRAGRTGTERIRRARHRPGRSNCSPGRVRRCRQSPGRAA